MIGLRFQDPLWLLLLVPLLALAFWAIRRRRRAAILYSDAGIPASLPVTIALRVKRVLPWMGMSGMVLLIAALARPQHGREEYRIQTEGIAIEMCIDQSGSMEAMDFHIDGERVNRLAAVKKVFKDFVTGDGGLPGRPDDPIGLVSFGGYAHDKCPLTLDHNALLQILKTVKIARPIYDSQGRVINERLWKEEQLTAIGDAVALAVDRLKDVKAESKAIILLSDGENTAGAIDPPQAAEAAKAYGIKIYAIGVGSTGLAPFPVGTDRSGRTVLRPAEVRLDEQTLTMMAKTTGGRYFNAKDTKALEEVYAEIDKLEKTLTEGRLYTQYRELYQYPMFTGLALVLLIIGLASTRFRSLP